MFAHKRQGTVDVIGIKGPLNADVIEDAKEFLELRLSEAVPKIVLDFAGIALIDSAGLELLLDWQDRCAEKAGNFLLADVNELCRDALRITGVDASFEIFRDVPSAVGSFLR